MMAELNKSIDSSKWAGPVLLVLLVVGAVLYFVFKDTLLNTQAPGVASPEITAPQPQVSVADKLSISNESVKDMGSGFTEVVGEVTNRDTMVRSATLKATFFDTEGKILGTAVGAVNEISPGQTKTFNLMTNDVVTGYGTMKVQVDTAF